MKRILLVALLAAAVASGAPAERAYVTSNQIKIVDEAAGSVVGTIDLGKSFVRDMVFSSDGATAYVGHSRGIAVIDVATSVIRDTWSDRAVNDLVLRERDGALYTLEHTSGGPYEVVVYDAATGAERRRFAVDTRAVDVVVADAANRVYTTNLHRAQLTAYDAPSGEARGTFGIEVDEETQSTYLSRSLLSADGREIYVVLNGEHAGVRVLDAETGAERRTISLGHPAFVRDAVLSPDGTRLYIAAIDHLSVVDVAAGIETAWVPLERPHQGVSVSADGRRLFVANPVYDDAGAASRSSTRKRCPSRRTSRCRRSAPSGWP